jgi:integrase
LVKKVSYERETKEIIDDWDLHSAHSYSESGWIKGKVAEWRVSDTPGLTLRIIPGKVVWYIRRRDMSLRLGLAKEISVENAKFYAGQVHLAAKRKRNLREFVDVLLQQEVDRLADGRYKSRAKSAEVADWFADDSSLWAYRKRIGDTGITWTWKALTFEFLKYKTPKLKLKYRKQYEAYFNLKEFEAVNDKLVCEIRLHDLERLRDAIHLNHAPSAVHRALTQSKTMLSWAWKYHATRSGLQEVQAEWWNRWSFEYKTRERTHAPTVAEIARTLVLAETFRNLGEGEHETYSGTLGALWAVALTAQRTGALLKMRLDRMFEATILNPKLNGWEIANWTSDEMKGGKDGGRPHSLPVPPKALDVLRRFHKEAGGNSEWMFPAADSLKHVTPSALNQLMYRLQGRVYDHTIKQKPNRKGKPGPKPQPKKLRRNLFSEYGITPWTLHDCRRTITTFLDDRRLGGAATAILGHKISTSKIEEREKLAPVTEQHYNRSQKIDLKAEGMALWVEALLVAYKDEREKLDTRAAQVHKTAA